MEKTYDLTEAQALYYDDLKRLRGQRGKLFELFLDGRWHSNHECAKVGGFSYNDSIFAFRQEGWLIESRRVKGGHWKFRLVGRAEQPTGHKPMTRPQKVVASHYMYVITELLGDDAAWVVWCGVPDWMQAPPRAIEGEELIFEEAQTTEERERVAV